MSFASKVAKAVDADAIVELVCQAVQIPSVTPNEASFAQWLCQVMEQTEVFSEASLVDCEPNRPNVYGTAGGKETENNAENRSRSLLLCGHLDTVAVDDWINHWQGSDREDPFSAPIIDGAIWGRGVADQKAGICAIIEALRAFERCNLQIAGKVSTLFVCDEESGQRGSGVSAGMRAAVRDKSTKPLQADFAIYTEPTTSAIYTAQMGFLIADITYNGVSAYFGRPELGVDALKAGHELLTKLWQHSEELESTVAPHELLGKAFLLVTAVNSGGNIAVPGHFELSLIRKVLPGENLDEAAVQISTIANEVAKAHAVDVTVDFSAPRDHQFGGTPDELDVNHLGVTTLAGSIESLSGSTARIEGAPYWSEKPFLRELGIPGVYFAPGDISHCHTPFERLDVDELVTATRTLAHFIAQWCGVAEQ